MVMAIPCNPDLQIFTVCDRDDDQDYDGIRSSSIMTDSSSSSSYGSNSSSNSESDDDDDDDDDDGQVFIVERSTAEQQRYDTMEIHRRHYSILLNEATKVDRKVNRINLDRADGPRKGRAKLLKQQHLRTVATSLRQQAMDVQRMYLQHSFDVMCDELRRNVWIDPHVCPEYFPKGYAKDLGECLQHNTHMTYLSLNVSRMLCSNDDNPDVSEQQHATIESLVRYLKTSPCLKTVFLTWKDDDELEQRTTTTTETVVDQLTKAILDAVAINSNIEEVLLNKFHSSPICLESFFQKSRGQKTVSLREFCLHHYDSEERARIFSYFTSANSSTIRILLEGKKNGTLQCARVIGSQQQDTPNGSPNKIEVSMTTVSAVLSQVQAMTLVLSTFPYIRQLVIQNFQWGDTVSMEYLLQLFQYHNPTTTVPAPPPRGVVKLSLTVCKLTEATRTLLVQYMQTPLSKNHHHGCSLRELYVQEDGLCGGRMVAGATSTGATIASMVAMQPSKGHSVGLESEYTSQLVPTYGSQIQLLSLLLWSNDSAFTSALKTNPNAFRMKTLQLPRTLQLSRMGIPYYKDSDFANLVQVLPNFVTLRELRITKYDTTPQEKEASLIMLRSIRDNGSLHRVTAIYFAHLNHFDSDFEDDDDRQLDTPYDQSISRLVRAYCRRNQELADLLAKKTLVATDQDTAAKRKPTKRHKIQDTNESSAQHAYSTCLLPTLLAAANQTRRTRLTLMVSGLLNWSVFIGPHTNKQLHSSPT